MTWWQSHRRYSGGELDVLVHANSGCQLNDHTEFGIWMGTKWEMNTVGLACCLHGPPGCFCYDTYYISRGSSSSDNKASASSKCLAVNKTHGQVVYQSCDLSSFDPSLMWHEVTYQEGYHEIDSLGWSFGKESGTDNCIGAAACRADADVEMAQCHNNDVHKTRFRFAGSADNSDIGKLVSDMCS